MSDDARGSHTLTVSQVLLVSLSSGLVVGALALCFTNALADLFGVQNSYGFTSIFFRCVVAAFVSLLALFPMIAIARHRRDLLASVLSGPQIGFWGCAVFLAGGTLRWGTPPDFMWPIFGAFILYAVALNLAAQFIAKRYLNAPKTGPARPGPESPDHHRVQTDAATRSDGRDDA